MSSYLQEKPYVLILAGGLGTRLWPLSCLNRPKQLLRIISKESLLEETIQRALLCTSLDRIVIGTNAVLKDIIQKEITFLKEENFLIEPKGKNTAPIIALFCHKLKIDNVVLSTPIIVLSADQFISKNQEFQNTINKALKLVSSSIVCLGINPTRPDTGYGYIHLDTPITNVNGAFQIHSFLEKPTLELAKKYIQSDEYLWNAGIFIFSIEVFLEELYKHAPEIFNYAKMSAIDSKNSSQHFLQMPEISIDYALLEKTKRISIIEASFVWDDIGSFLSFSRLLASNQRNEVSTDPTKLESLDSSDNIIHTESLKVALLGVKNLVVVESNGVLLVAHKDSLGELKNIREKVGEDFF